MNIRQERIGKENIQSIENIDVYISDNYLQDIKDRIDLLSIKRSQIEDLRLLYESLNTTNTTLINTIKTSSKYIDIINNQLEAEPLIDELNIILNNLLNTINSNTTINNLNYKEELYGIDKVSINDGEFISVESVSSPNNKAALNKDMFNVELRKLEPLPPTTQPLSYVATDNNGNIILKRDI